MGEININPISFKLNKLKELVLKHIDILVVYETKLNKIIPNSQFI